MAILLALLALGASACDPLASSAGAAKSCDLGFIPVKPTVTGPNILGNAWAKCDAPPETHDFTLSLQLRTRGAGWTNVVNTISGAIPRPRRTYEVKTACQPGVWRVRAFVTGSLRGHEFSFADTSVERFVTVQDCARGR